jgi:hypothetical protein
MLHNSKILTLATPAYVQFQNLFRVKKHFAIEDSIPKAELEKIPTQTNGAYAYELLAPLYKSHCSDTYKYYESFNNNAEYLHQNIVESFKKNGIPVTCEPGSQIINDIRDFTHFERGLEDWDITHVVRKYRLTSTDVFNALITDAMPYNMGVFAYDEKKVAKSLSEFCEKVSAHKQHGEKTVYIDYWYGIGIKSHFPVDIHNDETPFKLSIRRYNDRNGNTGFLRIISMLAQTFERRNPDYAIPVVKECILVEKELSPKYDEKYDIDANKSITPSMPSVNSDAEYIWKYSIEQKQQGYFNHRSLSYPDKPATWDYMMRVFYDKYVKDVPGSCMYLSLAHLFQFRDNTISGKCYNSNMSLDPNSQNCCSIVNMIIYGKVDINWEILERLLPLIRFKTITSGYTPTTQLDNYVISEISYPGLEGPVYKIDWRDDNVATELERPKTDYEKLIVAKTLIRLMNEVPPELLNFNNYYHVCSWYHRNDMGIQMVSNM